MRFGPIRRALASSGALLLGVSCLLTAAKPAAAASPPPWRFYNVVDARQAIVPGGTLGRVLTCPDGYGRGGGGGPPTKERQSLHSAGPYLEYTNQPSRSYHIGLRNSAGPGGP